MTRALFRLVPRARVRYSGTKMHVVNIRQWKINFHNYQEIGDNLVVGVSRGCEKVNTACTVKTCSDFCPCPSRVPEYYLWSWCMCPGTVPKLVIVIGHQQKAMFRLVPMPGHGAPISARAPTKGYVQTPARPRPPSLNRAKVILAVILPSKPGFFFRFLFQLLFNW